MIERAGTDGRVVTIDQLINSQRGAAETVRGLWNTHGSDPGITFHFLNNGADRTSEGGIETATPQNYNESRRTLNDLLNREYREKRISEAAYQRIRGSCGEPGKPQERRDRGDAGR